MMAARHSYRRPPALAALCRIRKAMNVILHLGAHRTASTSFQTYLCDTARLPTVTAGEYCLVAEPAR